jgi:teichuronic acid biosynthesis glycosyltransferase TuaG
MKKKGQRILKKVTIVIPSYNAQNSIEKTIGSTLEQIYENIEIVVINDNPVDLTCGICKAFNSIIRFIDLKEDVGGAQARNLGVENSDGDNIAFFDADDVF